MNKSKFKIIYDEKGGVFSDFSVLKIVDDFIEVYKTDYKELGKCKSDYIITVGVENFLTGVRLAVAEGRLDCEDVIIVHENIEYHLDKYGAYQEVFCLENFQQKLLDKILQANFKMEEEK